MGRLVREALQWRHERIAQDVLTRYRAGETLVAIARSMRSPRVSVGELRTILKKAGVSLRSEKRSQASSFVDLYKSGLRISEIVTLSRASRADVYRSLKAGGVTIDSRDRVASSITRLDVELIRSLYESGATMEHIGRMVIPPISRERVRQILRKAGAVTGGTGRKNDPVAFMRKLRNPATSTWRELAKATGNSSPRARLLASELGVLNAASRLLQMRQRRHSRVIDRHTGNAMRLPLDEMRAMRAAGKTWSVIAQFAGCSVSSARIYMHPGGTGDTRARSGREKMVLPLEGMREMRLQGFSDGQIGKKVGCSIGTVRNRIGLRKPE